MSRRNDNRRNNPGLNFSRLTTIICGVALAAGAIGLLYMLRGVWLWLLF